MQVINMRFKKVDPEAMVQKYAHRRDSGMDLFTLEEEKILPGEHVKIRTGIAVELPDGYGGRVHCRSSTFRNDYQLLVITGTIDNGYRGEIHISCVNVGRNELVVSKGQRIAQLVVSPVVRANLIESDTLSDSERGKQGFGSTGE